MGCLDGLHSFLVAAPPRIIYTGNTSSLSSFRLGDQLLFEYRHYASVSDDTEGPQLFVCEIHTDGSPINSVIFEWRYVRLNNSHCIRPFHPPPVPELPELRFVGVVLELDPLYAKVSGTRRVFLTEGNCNGNSLVKSSPINVTGTFIVTLRPAKIGCYRER